MIKVDIMLSTPIDRSIHLISTYGSETSRILHQKHVPGYDKMCNHFVHPFTLFH